MNLTEKKLRAVLILEVLGRPPEHLKETLEKLTKSLGEEKGVEIKNKKINEPSPLKDKKEFFTNFAEIEVEVDSLLYLAMLMFKYMPAHIEILSPENLMITNNEMGEIFNELTRRLHGYDEIARIIQIEKKLLEKKLKALLEEKKGKKEDKEEKKK